MPANLILAIDQSSTTTGIAIGSSSDDLRGGYRFGSITTPKSPEMGERLAYLFRELDKIIKREPLDMICYEAPFFPTFQKSFNVSTISSLQKVAGCVQTIAALHRIPVEEYTSDAWRATVLGFSEAPRHIDPKKKRAWLKTAVANKVKSLGYRITKDDEADAIGLLMHAHSTAASKRAQGNLMDMVKL